jgi:hypothetical protein
MLSWIDMSISHDNTAPQEIEILDDEIPASTATLRSVSELMSDLSQRLREHPEDWKRAVLETVGQWPEATEKVDGVRLSYLVGGEAFDWRLLASRILNSVGNAPQPDVWHAWLDMPDLFGGFTEAEFMRILGVDKSRACLSFFYGVTVEQGLVVAAREEIVKRRVASGREPSDDKCDDAYQRLYGNDREGLWDEFCAEAGLLSREGSELNPGETTLRQDDQFMYWLFKRRMDRSDPARVASDTLKGLAQLERMLRSHDRRKRLLREIERGSL